MDDYIDGLVSDARIGPWTTSLPPDLLADFIVVREDVARASKLIGNSLQALNQLELEAIVDSHRSFDDYGTRIRQLAEPAVWLAVGDASPETWAAIGASGRPVSAAPNVARGQTLTRIGPFARPTVTRGGMLVARDQWHECVWVFQLDRDRLAAVLSAGDLLTVMAASMGWGRATLIGDDATLNRRLTTAHEDDLNIPFACGGLVPAGPSRQEALDAIRQFADWVMSDGGSWMRKHFGGGA